MIREEIKQLKTGTRELRNFGVLVGAVFAALGLLFLLRGKARYPYFLAPGILLLGNFLVEKTEQKPLDKDIDWLKEFELD